MSFYDQPYEVDQVDEILPGVKVTRAGRKPCPVCGNTTGDCTSPNYNGPGHIVMLGKEKELAETDRIILQEDVWEERVLYGTTTSKFLVGKKGQTISRKKATELGII